MQQLCGKTATPLETAGPSKPIVCHGAARRIRRVQVPSRRRRAAPDVDVDVDVDKLSRKAAGGDPPGRARARSHARVCT